MRHHRPQRGGQTTLLKILSRITEPTEGAPQTANEIYGRVGSLLEVGPAFTKN